MARLLSWLVREVKRGSNFAFCWSCKDMDMGMGYATWDMDGSGWAGLGWTQDLSLGARSVRKVFVFSFFVQYLL